MRKSTRRALLGSGAIIGIAMGTAHAQEPVQTAQGEEAAAEARESIQVTGTRILRRDAVAESPILTVAREEITTSGYVTVEQFLNTLPQVTPGISSQSNNPSSGGRAFIDLRGMGAGRNLVLMDGRRPMPALSGGTVDVNTIPAALVERTEIITGGAAATYGADAVAGVVNFIMRTDFEGFEADSQYSLTEQNDGSEFNFDLTLGGNFAQGRGNAVFSASYFTREGMYKDARGFSAQASGVTGSFPGGGWSTGQNAPDQAAVDALFGANQCNTNGGDAGFGFNPDGTLFCTGVRNNPNRNAVGYTGPESHIAQAFFPDRFSYNFEPDNYLRLPLNRWNMFTHVTYDVNEYFRPYARAMFTNYNATQELAPTPTGGFSVPVTNPFLPNDLRILAASRDFLRDDDGNILFELDGDGNQILDEDGNPIPRGGPDAPLSVSKRFNALGGRTGLNNHDVWQITAGAEGSIFGTDTWNYDIYASYGLSNRNEIQGGNVVLPNVQRLLEAADGGASICTGGYNPFGAATTSQSCIDYISQEAKNLTLIEQSVVEANVTGDLFDLPAGTVQAAFGASYRSLDFDFRPDAGLAPGIVAGFNSQLPNAGYLDWFDIYGEMLVPLISGVEFAEDVSVTLGYRRTDNNASGTADSWKINADWTVNDWLRFRGGVQQAIRSPSIQELFAPQVNGFPNFTNGDPCNTTGSGADNDEYGRNGANGAQVAALCAAQSAVAGGAGYSQPAAQATGIFGGNPDLVPEEARSYTIGFVAHSPFDNPWAERLYVSVDYWSISLENQIDSFGAFDVVQRCYNRDQANPNYDPNNSWCQLFNRDPDTGGVIDLQLLQTNDQETETSGVDITLGWGYDMGAYGDLSFNLVGTWVEKFNERTTVSPDDPTYNYAGFIGGGTAQAIPEWRATLNTAYTIDRARFQLTTRWIDAMAHRNVVTGGSPVSNTGTPATWYLDLRGSYDLTDRVTLRAGVNNLLNQEPRLYSPNVQANTDPSMYDVLGRRYFVGVNARF